MSRRRDHHPRFDTTVCPDPAACERLFHPALAEGDVCECCGDDIADPEHAHAARFGVYDRKGGGWLAHLSKSFVRWTHVQADALAWDDAENAEDAMVRARTPGRDPETRALLNTA